MKLTRSLLLAFILLGVSLSACAGTVDTAHLTPIPTLIPVTLPTQAPPEMSAEEDAGVPCPITAADLIGAWVTAETPETEPFPFTSEDGKSCIATFEADVLPLFLQGNLWFPGALPCSSCHTADLATSDGQMDMSSYAGILAGSQRIDTAGEDILGGGNWEASRLYEQIITRAMPEGRPADSPEKGPTLYVGTEGEMTE